MTIKHQPLPAYKKAIYVALAVLLLFLGLLGLIMPVLPGVLFVAVAIFLLTKVSRRVERWAHGQPALREAHIRMQSMSGMNWGSKIQLSFWMSVDAVARGAAASYRWAHSTVQRFR